MGKISFGNRGGRVATSVKKGPVQPTRSAEEVVREIKLSNRKSPGEDYRERSLRIHGLFCARCGRAFDEANRHLLTVHHKDGNHHNNPADGSNWENLCVYCHEDEHSRGLLGDHYAHGADAREAAVVYADQSRGKVEDGPEGSLAAQLKKALEKKTGKG